ncbi:ras guanine nucleotide exchange factor domain-containing protein [Chytridium lagenaria]|nr:ras guanine nucleotide exchange factor domain-containing protein [Chytridium lagenaria]
MSSSVASRAAAGMTGGGFLPSKLTTHSRGASETRKPSLVNASTFSSTNSLTDHRPKSTVQQDDDDATPSSGVFRYVEAPVPLSTLEPPKTTMSDLDPTIVAQQFTLMEHTQFRRIKIEEFYCQAWNQPQKVKSRLSSLIGWFNRVAYGVASEVVGAAKVKDRVGVLKRFIFIAHLCLKWNNFNTVFEIVAGLNLGAITRLKKTWKALPSKYWDVWNQLNRTVSDEGSYRVYRQSITLLKDRKPETPMLPYLGVNLKDLTFAEDGNPTYMTSNVINFTKFRMISRLLESIVASQRGTYEFKSDERVQGWLKEDWVCLDTNELYELSRQCEPRVPVST